jgi:hypothetical protein
MEKMIAYCGEVCSDCGALIATRNDDDAKRREIAALWTKEYKHDFKPGDINCDGCLSAGERVFIHCHHCEIRKCGVERGVVNCAYCDDYVCEKLTKFFDMVPQNQTRLDKIRKGL